MYQQSENPVFIDLQIADVTHFTPNVSDFTVLNTGVTIST